MDKKTTKELRAEARALVAGYSPACDEETYEDTVLKLAAVGYRMVEAAGGIESLNNAGL